MEIKQVNFATAYAEMAQEMADHWDEVPFGEFDLALDLNRDTYSTTEEGGYLRCYMAYDSGVPVAYMSVFAGEMIQHKGTMQATTDAFYVSPDYRKSGIFGKLIEFVELDLASCGIRFFTVGTNPMYKGKTAQFLEHSGYCKTEVLYTKELMGDR